MKRVWVLLCCFFFMPIFATGESQITIEQVIQHLREARMRTEDFSADLLQEKRISLLKEKVVSRGKIRYKKPHYFLIEFFHPEPSQMVFDGKTLLLYFKEEKVA